MHLSTSITFATVITSIAAASSPHPCADIAALGAAYELHADIELAWACMRAVPFKLKPALQTLKAAERMASYQSDLEFLADPPAEYPEGKVDILGGIKQIRNQAKSGHYDGQYAFEKDLALLFRRAYDYHFEFEGVLFGNLIWFQRPDELQIISASKDGKSTPKVYLYSDAHNANAPEVTKINGVDTTSFLLNEANTNDWANPHARYNLMFFQSAFNDQTWRELFLEPSLYPGRYTELTYSNGTTQKYENRARLYTSSSWSAVVDGETLYQTWVATGGIAKRGDDADAFATQSAKKSSRVHIPNKFKLPPGKEPKVPDYYPRPALEHNMGFPRMAGYFIDTPNEKDVAVLVIPTFQATGMSWETYESSFTEFIQAFLRMCTSRNSPKLVLDVRGNGGGYIDLGLETFKQIFPRTEYFQGERLRIDDATNLTIQTLAKYPEIGANAAFLGNINPWDYRAVYSLDGNLFDSPDAMIGNNIVRGARVSNVVRAGTARLNSGYIGAAAPFDPKDVLLLSDGACGSTCSRFVEMLTHDAGIHTLAVGGIPKPGPMAVTGGSKGIQVNELSDLIMYGDKVVQKIRQTAGRAAAAAANRLLPRSAAISISSARVNSFDGIRSPNNEIPTQFLVDDPDCRMWYTPQSFLKPEQLWLDAYRATWGKGGEDPCIWRKPVTHTKAQKTSSQKTGSSSSGQSSPSRTDGGSGSGGDGSDASHGGEQGEAPENGAAQLSSECLRTSVTAAISAVIVAFMW